MDPAGSDRTAAPAPRAPRSATELPRLLRDGAAADRAVQAILALVMSGELAPGEHLRQEELAITVGASRAAVRDALRVLAEQGLLRYRPRAGYVVSKRNADDLAQIYAMLDHLENLVITTVVWPQQPVLTRLDELQQQMHVLVDQADGGPMIELNRAFHFAVFELSPLDVVLIELRRLWTLAAPYISDRFITAESRLRTVAEHAQIIEALRRHDREALLTATTHHRRQRQTLAATILEPRSDAAGAARPRTAR